MEKKSLKNIKMLKRYNPDRVTKDATIAFFAGIAGGITVWCYAFIAPIFIRGDYKSFIPAFILFLITALIMWFLITLFCRKIFAKEY